MQEDSEFGRELIAALQEAVEIVQGKKDAARVHLPPGWPDVRAIRARMGLSREVFASRFGLKATAVREWEQGLRRPDPAAQTLLRVIDREPEAVERALAAA